MTTVDNVIARIFFNRWAAFSHDVLCIPLAMLLAYWLRFNLGDVPPELQGGAKTMLVVTIPTQAALFWAFDFYRGFWRFASLPDLVRIVQSVAVGTMFCVLVVVFGQVTGVKQQRIAVRVDR